MECKKLISAGKYTCIGSRKGIFSFAMRGNGIKPLVWLYDTDPGLLKGVNLSDKLIGKAAAMVAVLGGAEYVWADIMSEPAIEYLSAHGIAHSYEKKVPFIENRAGDGMCPLEMVAKPISDPAEGYIALKNRIAQLMAGK